MQATYAYNTQNRLNTITTRTERYSFAYDAFGNTSEITVGGISGATHTLVTYEYADRNGKLQTLTYGNGKTLHYIYDELDRVSEIWYTDNDGVMQKYLYTYTLSGQLHSLECTESGRLYQYRYNSAGQMLSYIESDTDGGKDLVQTAYTYDQDSRPESVAHQMEYDTPTGAYPGWVMYWYEYDDTQQQSEGSVGALSSLDIATGGTNSGLTIEYEYDELYRPSVKDIISDAEYEQLISYEYRQTEEEYTTTQIERYTTSVWGPNGWQTTAQEYTYDAAGNIQTVTDSAGNVTQYTYDNLNQLIREDNPYLNKSYVYSYDLGGNRTGVSTFARGCYADNEPEADSICSL